MAEELIPEVWEVVYEGKKLLGAYGQRDVLIIETSESLEGPDIVSRRKGKLTLQDNDYLDSQGISSECREDDVKLMEERYRISHLYEVECVERDPKSVEYITSRIVALFNNTKKPGVIIHYIGPGRRSTGDWCFKDGFLSFLDLMTLYKQHFHNRTLALVSDCSYSGKWIKQFEEFLDREGVQPCGHYARAAGMLLYLACSCRSHEIPTQLSFSARGCRNDRSTEDLFIEDTRIEQSQHSDIRNGTRLTCKADSFDTPCLLVKNFTWLKKRISMRIHLHRNFLKWKLFLLIDDEQVQDKVTYGELDPHDYGEVIREGEGVELSEEDNRWLNKKYYGHF